MSQAPAPARRRGASTQATPAAVESKAPARKRKAAPGASDALPPLNDPKGLADLNPNPRNPRMPWKDAKQRGAFLRSLKEFGDLSGVVFNRSTGQLVGGHKRVDEFKEDTAAVLDIGERLSAPDASGTVAYGYVILSSGTRFAYREVEWPAAKEAAANLAANKWGAAWDSAGVADLLSEAKVGGFDLELTGFDLPEVEELLPPPGGVTTSTLPPGSPAVQLVSDRFGYAPFSVLNAREGWWQNRKRQWVALGIRSEIGRGENLLQFSETVKLSSMGKGKSNDKQLTWQGQIGKDIDHYRHKEGKKGAVPGGGGKGVFMRRAADGTMHPSNGKGKAKAYGTTDWIKEKGLSGGAQDVANGSGTSIFDPVLCELAYRWFSPPEGVVVDPFAGGSVRGIVAAKLGRKYHGMDLRAEQVEANRVQWEELGDKSKLSSALPSFEDDALPDLTPVEKVGGYYVKRDDAFCIGGGRGGKVRTCWGLAQGAKGLVTAGSRSSPQVNIVAQIARKLGIPCRVHCPQGELSPEVRMARAAGAEVIQHPAGYNNVIIARAREDAAERGWTEIPFGMECQAAVDATAKQVANIPKGVKRLVMPVGSGMSLAGVLHGLIKHKRTDIKVVGVRVGADPTERLNAYAPKGWEKMVELVDSGKDYHEEADDVLLADSVRVDSIYEGKCLPFLKKGDMLWVVGIRASEAPQKRKTEEATAPQWYEGDSKGIDRAMDGVQADMLLTCPPYADLEVYSDDPADISTMEYPAFKKAYREIIKKACDLLKPNSFAVCVVGEVRDKKGHYLNFVGDTVDAFRDAGLAFYNEAILVTSVGSLPLRIGKQFSGSRKLGKTHQNVLVFLKGDGKRAAERCGDCSDTLELSAAESEAAGDTAGAAPPVDLPEA